MRIVIITGASSGMGREFALQLDKKLHSIDEYWLVGRNEEELAKTKKKWLKSKYSIQYLEHCQISFYVHIQQ